MNSLTYLSRQFDVLASSSPAATATASTAPQPPCLPANTNLPGDNSEEIPVATTSHVLHEAASKLLPTPRKAKGRSSGTTGASIGRTSSRSDITKLHPVTGLSRTSPSPRRRRRRRVARAFILRPFISLWQLLLLAWVWVSHRDRKESKGDADDSDAATEKSDETLVDVSTDTDSSPVSPSSELKGKRRKDATGQHISPSARRGGTKITFSPSLRQARSSRPPLTPYPSQTSINTMDEDEEEEGPRPDESSTPRHPEPQLLPAPRNLDLVPHPPALTFTTRPSSPFASAPPQSQLLLPNPLRPSLLTRTPPPATRTHNTSSGTPSRGPTPYHMPKTLVLDLDETLIHSTSPRSPMPVHHAHSGADSVFELGGLFLGGGYGGTGLLGAGLGGGLLAGTGGLGNNARARGGHMVEVVLNGRSTLYTVYKRPFVDYFLRKVSAWYTVVIFTASVQEYADPVIDWLDAGRGILGKRFFRESCTQLPNGSYAKDLSIIDPDLSRICMVDNSPFSYTIDQANGIPIEGWTSDPTDEALLDLLPVLDSLRFTSDVRHVLGIRGF